tara:strand:+ start:5418 stop:6446 length:1029 start_codon:yes stop_codon:yes gene_type:complete
MEFRLSQDQKDLVEGAAAFFAGECPPAVLRRLEGGMCEELWSKVAQMGFLGILAPEEVGGLGLDLIDLTLLVEQAGRVALPLPVVENAGLAVPLLAQCGESELLDKVMSGSGRVIVVHPAVPFVNHAEQACAAIICKRERIGVLPAAALRLEKVNSIDPLRSLSRVSYDAWHGKEVLVGEAAGEMEKQVFTRAAVLTAAELLGLAAGMIEMATEYAKTREQFGKPIGSFQALKHHLANAFVKLEFARPVVYRAAALSPQTSKIDVAVAHAKLAAGDAACFAAETAIQVFGGMGYTYEADLHFWMKRVWALQGLWGDRDFHTSRLERYVLADGAALGPGQTFE